MGARSISGSGSGSGSGGKGGGLGLFGIGLAIQAQAAAGRARTAADLAALGGFAGKNLRVYAANGYVTTIHAQDYMNAPLLLAYAENGKAISVLHKGPLTVVLPPTPLRLRHESYGYAWVWYATRITPAP